jgi:hypothetical protein
MKEELEDYKLSNSSKAGLQFLTLVLGKEVLLKKLEEFTRQMPPKHEYEVSETVMADYINSLPFKGGEHD